jgi:nitroimidazol reductase NimA-like FMN-containing flavoprotein (pyridoxamine 5'-phosphate oxidase superfamily)
MGVMRNGQFAPTERTKVRRLAERGRYDWDTIDAILDEGLVCHLGFEVDGRPWVVPTTYVRVDNRVYVHGAVANFALRTLAAGAEVCVTVTLLDGLVLARSAFHHSMNYRSVMLFGRAAPVEDEQEKHDAMVAIVEHLVPGRTADTRLPSPQELRKTLVVRLALDECSAKVRTGGPLDDEDDMNLGYWAGQLPLSIVPGVPIPDVAAGAPDYLLRWSPTSGRVR